MNVLGKLPVNGSPPGQLNYVDFLKMVRMALILGAGTLIDYLLEHVVGLDILPSSDLDTLVLIPLVSSLLELVRRWLAGQTPQYVPPPTPTP